MSAAPKRYRLITTLIYASPLFLALLIYGYCVSLPFFLDDGPHFQILAQTNGLQQWGDFPAFPFYRPLVFSVWKIAGWLAGDTDAVMLHSLNLFCFGLTGVLVGQITRRAAPPAIRNTAAFLAGASFVIFPFSYQAVALVAALFHLTLTLGIVGCLWLALLWLDGRIGIAGLIGCWVCAFVAIFSHETGVLLIPLLLGLIFVVYGKQLPSPRKLRLLVLPIFLLTLIYLALWLSFRPRGENALTTEFDVAFAALLQGLIYPVTRLVRPFIQGDLSAGRLLVLAFMVLAAVLIISWQWPKARRFVAYGLGWYLIAIFPAALLLPAGYVLGQLRLALLASVGGAIFWGVILALLFHAGQGRMRRRVFRVAALLIVGLFAFISLEFLGMRRTDFYHLRDFNREAVQLFAANDVISSGAVLVNAPDYIIPDEADRRFLLGSEGVLFVDETLDYNQQFWMNSDLPYSNVDVIGYRQIQRNEGFGFRAHPPDLETSDVIAAVRNARQVYVTWFEGKRFWPVLVGGTALDGANTPLVNYPEVDFALTEANATLSADGRTLTIGLRWQVNEPAGVKVFVHVVCDGAMIAQSDGYTWGDTYPFSAWSPEEIQTDIRTIRLNTLEGDCIRIYAGLYREADVTRLMAFDAVTGERYADDLFPLSLSGKSD
ncbi:MAG: hypothetical protein H7Y09_13975 [Chitinophagaceae bacterium]|nr:hypothetical protein [Anaerolineae bacterium]